jgi:hypothetical protein
MVICGALMSFLKFLRHNYKIDDNSRDFLMHPRLFYPTFIYQKLMGSNLPIKKPIFV